VRKLRRSPAVEWGVIRYCTICKRRRRFKTFRGRRNAACSGCYSLERHRVLWGWLSKNLPDGPILHMAPEPSIARKLQRPGYISADLAPGAAMVEADICSLPFDNRSFELVLCCHVLEHIPDDRKAMSELRRVTADVLVMQHPVDRTRATTYEDPSVTDSADREREFGQRDHVRIYGRDFTDRLRSAGFDVEVVRSDQPGADLYLCR
jgi:SAM-dependent methyltransferase